MTVMKCRRLKTLFGGALTLLALSGCPSIHSAHNWADGWIGAHIERLRTVPPSDYEREAKWKEKTYYLDNGNMVYIHFDKPGCLVHFEVDSNGLIVGYRLEGSRCD